ncbi:MAG: M28 family peptidase [Marinilabiliaceae bacterium]|nr:M28 family peptidase [Marinilabiliaceae bacterium]
MRNLIITLLFIVLSFAAQAKDKLILAKIESPSNIYDLFENQFLSIHYYNDQFIIATIKDGKNIENESVVLDEKAFSNTSGYFIVYCPPEMRRSYLEQVENQGKVLYSDNNLLIMKPLEKGIQIPPAKHDGMVFISQQTASLPKRDITFPVITEVDLVIRYLTTLVNTDSIIATVQHLQDFGTRVYFQPQAYQAEAWLQSKFENMGLDVSIQNVSVPLWGFPSTSSGNVIAIQTGALYPDEYIVCGAHYDSIVLSNLYNSPGADDNATGTAGIVEIARILSQYEFDRSIIYCCFSAEEVGMFGSKAYASSCSQQDMNILGYFNIDMTGYLQPGSNVHIDLIYPSFATPLATYYTNIANIYFPRIPITSYSSLPGGDSDHTSFNQNGYYGIFPFEDVDNHSPYIHTINDVIGLSVNTPHQCRIFTQVTFASIVTLAGVNIEPYLPISDFEASETEIFENNSIQFTDFSISNPTQWHWFFDGGTPAESFEQNPEIIYEIAGIYDVKLVVTNEYGSDFNLKTEYITVIAPPPPIADFIGSKTEINEGESIIFTDLSENEPTEWHWFFDGGTPAESFEQNPEIIYETAGIYDVKLVVSNEYGSDFNLKTEYITVKIFDDIKEVDTTPSILVLPNPTRGELQIESGETIIKTIEIFDMVGHSVLEYKMSQSDEIKHSLSLRFDLPNGIYFIQITTDKGMITNKLVKL